jgi:hypothetical protein
MANWTSSINCDPGLFEDVFREIKSKTENKKHARDVTLVCDAMGIHEDISYNRATGTFTGFVDLGKDIVVGDQDDTPAKKRASFYASKFTWKLEISNWICVH